jgi:hypothetical protein
LCFVCLRCRPYGDWREAFLSHPPFCTVSRPSFNEKWDRTRFGGIAPRLSSKFYLRRQGRHGDFL